MYLTNHSHDVTLIHRRDLLRAEKILQDRLFANPAIKVIWDSEVARVRRRRHARSAGRARPPQPQDRRRSAASTSTARSWRSAIRPRPNCSRASSSSTWTAISRSRPGSTRTIDPRRVRVRRRDGQDLPPGGDRGRDRLHGRARCRAIPCRRGIRGAAGGRVAAKRGSCAWTKARRVPKVAKSSASTSSSSIRMREPFLEPGEQSRDRHRIEFGQRAEQLCIARGMPSMRVGASPSVSASSARKVTSLSSQSLRATPYSPVRKRFAPLGKGAGARQALRRGALLR